MPDHSQHDTTPLIEALDGDEQEGGPSDLAGLVGVLGVRDARDLGDLACRIVAIGRSSHSPFGQHLVDAGERLLALAVEARRRLVADRLPEFAGTTDQQARRHETAVAGDQ